MEHGSYKKFALMLGTSFVIMYGVMYFNVADTGHIFLSTNRLYMAILMVAPMALVMLGFMRSMYKNTMLNGAIITLSLLAIGCTFALLRNQAFVDDEGFMHSMIPHHSSAILVSENADLSDPEVKELARKIIEAQREEIAQMKQILERMDKHSI